MRLRSLEEVSADFSQYFPESATNNPMTEPSIETVDNCRPGSLYSIAHGCTCPVLDNGHGRGYMSGVKDKDGNTLFVISADCIIHGVKQDAQ